MIHYDKWNLETHKSLAKGQITEPLGAMILELANVVTYSWVKPSNVSELALEEIRSNSMLKFCEKYLDKCNAQDGKFYTFAVVMMKNIVIDNIRRLGWTDELGGNINLGKGHKALFISIDYKANTND